MKSFVYIVNVTSRSRSGTTYKRVTLYQIKRNRLHLVGRRDFYCEDDFQAAFILAEEKKVLPRRAFARYEHTGSPKYNAWSLREAKIASFHQL